MRVVPLTQCVMSSPWELKKRAIVKHYYLWTVLWCLPDDCARGPMSNQAVQSLGTVVTDCHILGAFSLQSQQRQKAGADHLCWRWSTVIKLLVQLQRLRSATKQETSSDLLRPMVAPLMCCDSQWTHGWLMIIRISVRRDHPSPLPFTFSRTA